MRISDWSSDVCSSDLGTAIGGSDQLDMLLDLVDRLDDLPYGLAVVGALMGVGDDPVAAGLLIDAAAVAGGVVAAIAKIGRASGRGKCVSTCRSRWSPYH